MLTDTFLTVLGDAEPGARITGIVTWTVEPTLARADAVTRAARMKTPVLDAARACSGARINPLEGTCQAILEVPIEGWRELLRSRDTLLLGDDVRVEANVVAFSTLPEPP